MLKIEPTRFAKIATECVDLSTLSVAATRRRYYRTTQMVRQLAIRTRSTSMPPIKTDKQMYQLIHLMDEVSWFYLHANQVAAQKYGVIQF